MNSSEDFEKRLGEFGQRLRTESSMAKSVLMRIGSNVQVEAELKCERASSTRMSSFRSLQFGDISMKQRITLGGMMAATIFTIAFLTMGYSSSSNLFAEVAANVKKARSYTAEVVVEMNMADSSAGSAVEKIYWRFPGDYRVERKTPSTFSRKRAFDERAELPNGLAEVEILSIEKSGIDINHVDKTYRVERAQRGFQSPLVMLQSLGEAKYDSRKNLGKRDVNGVMSEGFVIDVDELDASAGGGTLEVWVDVKDQLPTEVILEIKDLGARMKFKSIKWNQMLPPTLFDATPPEGYADETKPEEDLAIQIAKITAAFQHYAELSGGHYPRVKMVYGDVTQAEMREFAGYKGPFKPEWYPQKAYGKILEVTGGLARINTILRENPDASYHGIGVGPDDTDEVLMRWKLPNGEYQLLYGDLRGEVVSADSPKSLK